MDLPDKNEAFHTSIGQEGHAFTTLSNIFKSYVNRLERNPSERELEDFFQFLKSDKVANEPTRLIIIAMRRLSEPVPEFISSHIDQVDIIEIVSDSTGYTISFDSLRDGSLAQQWSAHHQIKDPGLIAASVSRYLKMATIDTVKSTLVLYIEPEKDPVLTETIAGALNFPFDLYFEDPNYNQSILRLENAARNCFVPDDETLAKWKLMHVVDAKIASIMDIATIIKSFNGDDTNQNTLVEDLHDVQKIEHRVLIVSYFSLPTTLVSTQRLSYWHQTLGKIAAEDEVHLDVVWLSATYNAESFTNNRVIKDRGNYLVSSEIRQSLRRAIDIGVPTLGISWLDYVQEETKKWDEQFDTVIISVGPFGYLKLGNHFKNLWDAQIIYDFRDAYGGDPRMVFSKKQRAWIDEHEKTSVAHDDIIISVNNQCLQVIAPEVTAKRAVVNNGYNETIIDKERTSTKNKKGIEEIIRFVYCGTIFRNLGIDEFVEALSIDRHRLVHFGRDQTNSKILQSHEAVERRGFIADQSQLTREMLGCDAGILRLGGEITTGTTKIFDYIGCDLDIIIITDGKLENGAVHDLTKELNGIYWVKNNSASITKFVNSYMPTRGTRNERENFSRRHQASILLDLIMGQHLAKRE